MKTIKVGVIGAGFSARSHIEMLRRLPQVEIVAIASQAPDKAAETANKFGIPRVFRTADELIHSPDIQAIHNCTPNYVHYELNKKAMLAGKHLLSEKPLAMNSTESLQLMELAAANREQGILSGVCFNYRHYPLIAQVREMLSSGSAGKVNLVCGGYAQDWLLYDTDYNWRLDPLKNGPSRAIADIGSHWCDTLQYVLGRKITKVFADLKTVHPVRRKALFAETSTFTVSDTDDREEVQVETEDYGSVLVHFEGGSQGVFTVSQVSAGRKNRLYFEIAASRNTLAWDQEDPNRLWIGYRDQANEVLMRDPSLLAPGAAALTHYPGGHEEGWPDMLKNLFIDFYKSVQGMEGHQPTFATMEDGHRMMQVIDAILLSHKEQRWVEIDSIKGADR